MVNSHKTNMTNIEIYQGNQIGGCVTVITGTYKGKTHRIMIDYGLSLAGSETKKDFEYPWDDEPVDAVFFTHYHGDHVGRIMEIPENIPLYMGPTAQKAMINIQEALGHSNLPDAEEHLKEAELLKNNKRVRCFNFNGSYYDAIKDIPGFSVEPYSVDHSAYDAYMFLIETDDESRESGKYVTLHTGDFRGHGRRGQKMITLIKSYVHKFGKRKVDALVIEGTMMSRPKEKVLTEPQMQYTAAKYLSKHKYAFLVCSSTNVDSLASFYQAAQMASFPGKRYMYVYSPYFLKQLRLYSETAGPFSEVYRFDNTSLMEFDQKIQYGPFDDYMTQLEIMQRYGFIAVIKPEEFCEEYLDTFVGAYKAGEIREMPVIIYSMWDGYLEKGNKAAKPEWIDFFEKQEKKGIEVYHLHTSGHATSKMLAQVINAVNPQDEIIPMHTERPEAFGELPIRAELRDRIRKCGGI